MNKRLMVAGSVRIFSRYKLRSFFMSLGIVVGVAALVIMRSMGTGAEKDMLNKIEKLFSAGSMIVVNGGQAQHGGVLDPGKLSLEDLEAIDDQLDEIVDYDPVVIIGSQEIQYQGTNLNLMVVGHSERGEAVWGRGVTAGEFFSEADIRSTARVALIGHKAAEKLFGDENPVGKQIRIGNSPFRVKGVLESHGVDPHGIDRDEEVHVPITTIMRRLLNRDTISNAKLIVSSTEEVDNTVDKVADLLHERHKIPLDQPDDFTIYTPSQIQQAVRKANRVVTVYLPATAGIALLVAAIVIANIMLMGVRERIPEIGLRKAVGATNRQISLQFLLESLAVTSISGLIGVGLGAGTLVVFAHATNPEITLSPDSILLGLAAALLVGVLAGFLPARQAARQEPVEALR